MEFVWMILICVALDKEPCDVYNDGVGTTLVFQTKKACDANVGKLRTERIGESSGRKFIRHAECHKIKVRH
jgi:hypothetical protein